LVKRSSESAGIRRRSQLREYPNDDGIGQMENVISHDSTRGTFNRSQAKARP